MFFKYNSKKGKTQVTLVKRTDNRPNVILLLGLQGEFDLYIKSKYL